MVKKRTRGNPVPLIIEEHPEKYEGYPFITLVQYNDQHLLTIIDNCDNKNIKAFVLDLCGPEGVNEEHIIKVATYWFNNNREQYPVSFEFSKLGISSITSKIYRTFPKEFVSRVIGPVPVFEMSQVHKTRRRRRKSVPNGVVVRTVIFNEN